MRLRIALFILAMLVVLYFGITAPLHVLADGEGGPNCPDKTMNCKP